MIVCKGKWKSAKWWFLIFFLQFFFLFFYFFISKHWREHRGEWVLFSFTFSFGSSFLGFLFLIFDFNSIIEIRCDEFTGALSFKRFFKTSTLNTKEIYQIEVKCDQPEAPYRYFFRTRSLVFKTAEMDNLEEVIGVIRKLNPQVEVISPEIIIP